MPLEFVVKLCGLELCLEIFLNLVVVLCDTELSNELVLNTVVALCDLELDRVLILVVELLIATPGAVVETTAPLPC